MLKVGKGFSVGESHCGPRVPSVSSKKWRDLLSFCLSTKDCPPNQQKADAAKLNAHPENKSAEVWRDGLLQNTPYLYSMTPISVNYWKRYCRSKPMQAGSCFDRKKNEIGC